MRVKEYHIKNGQLNELPQHTALIPYETMFKEQSKKWQTDDRKVMNWAFDPNKDFYISPNGVRFNFHAYHQRTDTDGFVRVFKEYQAEKIDASQVLIPKSLTPMGNLRKIIVNPFWEYHKEKQKERLATPKIQKINDKEKSTWK